MRLFSGNGNGQCFQAVFAGNARSATVQYIFNEISDFFQVGIREAREEMIGEGLFAAASGQENCGNLFETPDEN